MVPGIESGKVTIKVARMARAGQTLPQSVPNLCAHMAVYTGLCVFLRNHCPHHLALWGQKEPKP